MAQSIKVLGVPHGFTGLILWIRKTRNVHRGRRYRLDLIARNRQFWFRGEHYPTRAHAHRAATSLTGQRTKPWIIVG